MPDTIGGVRCFPRLFFSPFFPPPLDTGHSNLIHSRPRHQCFRHRRALGGWGMKRRLWGFRIGQLFSFFFSFFFFGLKKLIKYTRVPSRRKALISQIVGARVEWDSPIPHRVVLGHSPREALHDEAALARIVSAASQFPGAALDDVVAAVTSAPQQRARLRSILVIIIIIIVTSACTVFPPLRRRRRPSRPRRRAVTREWR